MIATQIFLHLSSRSGSNRAMSFNNLPNELLHHILTYVEPTYLHNLNPLSTRFAHLTRPFLFRSIKITSCAALYRFLEIVRLKPETAGLVHELEFGWRKDFDPAHGSQDACPGGGEGDCWRLLHFAPILRDSPYERSLFDAIKERFGVFRLRRRLSTDGCHDRCRCDDLCLVETPENGGPPLQLEDWELLLCQLFPNLELLNVDLRGKSHGRQEHWSVMFLALAKARARAQENQFMLSGAIASAQKLAANIFPRLREYAVQCSDVHPQNILPGFLHPSVSRLTAYYADTKYAMALMISNLWFRTGLWKRSGTSNVTDIALYNCKIFNREGYNDDLNSSYPPVGVMYPTYPFEYPRGDREGFFGLAVLLRFPRRLERFTHTVPNLDTVETSVYSLARLGIGILANYPWTLERTLRYFARESLKYLHVECNSPDINLSPHGEGTPPPLQSCQKMHRIGTLSDFPHLAIVHLPMFMLVGPGVSESVTNPAKLEWWSRPHLADILPEALVEIDVDMRNPVSETSAESWKGVQELVQILASKAESCGKGRFQELKRVRWKIPSHEFLVRYRGTYMNMVTAGRRAGVEVMAIWHPVTEIMEGDRMYNLEVGEDIV